MGLRAGVASDRGLVRPTNEDSFFLREGLYAVCDGMGGARGGEVASQMACLGLLGLNPESAGQQDLREAIEGANRSIAHRGAGEEHLMGMGTTLTAVMVKEGRMTLAHVGDSRAYLLRDGDLEQLSEDHSWVGEMVRRGELTPAQAAIHPHRNVITRVLGTEGEVQPDVIEQPAKPGDRVLLCSDGLTGMVADTEILELLASGEGPQETAEMLVKAAVAAGGEDNVTVVVIDVTDEEAGGNATGAASGPFSSQILFGPSDRGSLVAASSHRGRVGAGMRERFGRRVTPPPRPVSRPVSRDATIDSGATGQTVAEAMAAAGTGEAITTGGDEAPQGDSDPHTVASTPPEQELMTEDAPAGAGGEEARADEAVEPVQGGEAAAEPPVESPLEPPFDQPFDAVHPPAVESDTPASAPATAATPVAAPGGAARPRRGRRLRSNQLRMFVIILAVVVALAIAVGGFAFYNSTVYYVGTYADGTVALYRGLPTSVLGIDLSSVIQLGTARYDSLSPYDKQKVDSHNLVSEEEGQALLGSLDGPL
jgi:PPM family protein phosphatase